VALRQDEVTSLCDDVDLDRDRALVERCQAGDSAAFGNLYARYYERLLRFCQRRLNDRHEAEDAAQEAFARAWKALPNFAGERRFYPWLTVIAGNICTDMLRRRNRSTPTDDLELTAHQPLGAGVTDTSEELVLAAVDGELVNRALHRLSDRHQHVLAMREGSGWTYQQIADHEGVEIGTIETLLWRARQALKREFSVLSESKGALAGFLAGGGALLKRSVLRVAHRANVLQQSAGGSGTFRNAVAGVAVTSAAVAAAIITPQALSSAPRHTAHSTYAAPASAALANPPLPIATSPATGTSAGSSISSGQSLGSDLGSAVSGLSASALGETNTPAIHPTGSSPTISPLTGGTSSIDNGPSSGTPDSSSGDSGLGLPAPAVTALTPLTSGLNPVTSGLGNTISGIGATLGLEPLLNQLGLGSTSSGSSTSTSTTTPTIISGLTNSVTNTLKTLLGQN
jgi:RNA polymerase sigma-70 factor (ECF subfamily)